MHSGRGRGRPRKERKQHHEGEVVSQLDKQNANALPGDTINNKLSKLLTEELIRNENQELTLIPFIVKSASDSANFSPLSWYVDNPSDKDELYQTLQEVVKIVEECQRELKEHDNKSVTGLGAGMSTQYLLMIPDEQWSKPTIDEAFALYLIEVADLSRTRQRSVNFYRNVVCLV